MDPPNTFPFASYELTKFGYDTFIPIEEDASGDGESAPKRVFCSKKCQFFLWR